MAMHLVSRSKTTGLPNNFKPPIDLKLYYITNPNGQMIQSVIGYWISLSLRLYHYENEYTLDLTFASMYVYTSDVRFLEPEA